MDHSLSQLRRIGAPERVARGDHPPERVEQHARLRARHVAIEAQPCAAPLARSGAGDVHLAADFPPILGEDPHPLEN